MSHASPARAYALAVGAVLVVAGAVGFLYESEFSTEGSTDAVLGILDVNGWHNVVHLATGMLGLLMARSIRGAESYALGLGILYLAISMWGFILGDGGFILSIVPINTEDNVLHLALGLLGLIAYTASAPGRPATVRT